MSLVVIEIKFLRLDTSNDRLTLAPQLKEKETSISNIVQQII
jgi:hypothetical protein